MTWLPIPSSYAIVYCVTHTVSHVLKTFVHINFDLLKEYIFVIKGRNTNAPANFMFLGGGGGGGATLPKNLDLHVIDILIPYNFKFS